MEKKTNSESSRGNTFTKKIDNIVSKDTIHFSKTSKGTVQDKVKRMIVRDIESENH